MSDSARRFRLNVAAPAERQLGRLPAAVAAAIVELMVGALCEDPHRLGRPLREELTGLHVARRGVYRIVCEIDDETQTVAVLRIDHPATAYRPR